MAAVLKIIWGFLPLSLQIGFLAFFALIVILIVLRVVAKVLEAIPFL